jgi:hypothetical protein
MGSPLAGGVSLFAPGAAEPDGVVAGGLAGDVASDAAVWLAEGVASGAADWLAGGLVVAPADGEVLVDSVDVLPVDAGNGGKR